MQPRTVVAEDTGAEAVTASSGDTCTPQSTVGGVVTVGGVTSSPEATVGGVNYGKTTFTTAGSTADEHFSQDNGHGWRGDLERKEYKRRRSYERYNKDTYQHNIGYCSLGTVTRTQQLVRQTWVGRSESRRRYCSI
ncbi:unnamed protein product, partial [Amoebophrya sp. A120]|eukprot:GSA120T00013321001.1